MSRMMFDPNRFDPNRNRSGERIRSSRIDDEVMRRHAEWDKEETPQERRNARRQAREAVMGWAPTWEGEQKRARQKAALRQHLESLTAKQQPQLTAQEGLSK